jgi:hypothetical protein
MLGHKVKLGQPGRPDHKVRPGQPVRKVPLALIQPCRVHKGLKEKPVLLARKVLKVIRGLPALLVMTVRLHMTSGLLTAVRVMKRLSLRLWSARQVRQVLTVRTVRPALLV